MSLIKELEKRLTSIEHEPINPLLLNQVGVILYRLEDYENADKYFKKAYELDPNYKDILYNYAFNMYKRAKWGKAIDLLESYLQVDSGHKKAIEKLADCYFQQEKYEQAIYYYTLLVN